MLLAWYRSRLFWGGLLGFAFLIFAWGYRLGAPMVWWAGWMDVAGALGVGEGRVWVEWDVSDRVYPFAMTREGFGVEKLTNSWQVAKDGLSPALETNPNASELGPWKVVIGHWVLVIVYMIGWVGALIGWQRRKRRLPGPVTVGMGWKRIAIPVVGMVAMAIAMTRREDRLPPTWEPAFTWNARETWDLVNEDGVVTAEEIVELCYGYWGVRGDGNYETAVALVGQPDDPIPALRRMMGDAAWDRRAFAALAAGDLGDARLRPDLEKLMREDVTPLGFYPGKGYWTTVGGAAEEALKMLDRGGSVSGAQAREVQEHYAPWLQRAKPR